MWKKFCRWYLYRHLGWKTNVTVNHPEKFIICLAPHTSNWDFILGQLYAGAEAAAHQLLDEERMVLLASRTAVQKAWRHPRV